MDFTHLAATAPWTREDRPRVEVLRAILLAFIGLQQRHEVPVRLPPGNAGYVIGRYAHPWPEVFLQITGERTFRFPDRRSLVLRPGEMALIPRGVEHQERISDLGRGHACLVWMCLPGRLDLHVAVRAPDGSQQQVSGDAFVDYGAGSDRLCDELHLSGDPQVREDLLGILLAHARQVINGASLYAANRSPLIDRCLRSIAFRLHVHDLGVASLAEELGCTASHLGREFRAITGETLVGYIARQRIALAGDLLQEGRASVQAVAQACGFRDAAYFSRVFRKITGTSPVRMRGRAAVRER